MANGAVQVGHIDELESMAMKMVKVDGHRLCVVRTTEGVFALDQACPHEGTVTRSIDFLSGRAVRD